MIVYIISLSVITITIICLNASAMNTAVKCTDRINKELCHLPDCRCSDTSIPGNLKRNETPQLVFLLFDDAVSRTNFHFYKDELSKRKNHNGHPISATFFVSHEYTDYSMVHELWKDGHDIALHSISHHYMVDYWRSLNETGWKLEFVDQIKQMSQFANIPESDIQGARAPHLQQGGDSMYKVFYGGGFKWENSRPDLDFGLWPYTNDYLPVQECDIGSCPTGRYPGFWTVPIICKNTGGGAHCAMADACPVNTEAETFQLLMANFDAHYFGNRAPYQVSIHTGWVNGTGGAEIMERRKGYTKFLDYLATLEDTYIVSIARGLEWIQNPTAVSQMKNFKPFQNLNRKSNCSTVSQCMFADRWERYMVACAECPRNFPWVGNPLGL